MEALIDIEERTNYLTHLFGLVLSIAGAGYLLFVSLAAQDFLTIASALVFSLSLIFLYAASTLYHAATCKMQKMRFKIMDHCAIYCLIAGSYTPFTLITLQEGIGPLLFTTVWIIALFGILFKLFFTGRFRILSTLLYLGMGWLSLIAYEPIQKHLSEQALQLVFAGGLAYTLGSLFYLAKGIRFHHAIWHLFVLAGSACHYLTVLFYVV